MEFTDDDKQALRERFAARKRQIIIAIAVGLVVVLMIAMGDNPDETTLGAGIVNLGNPDARPRRGGVGALVPELALSSLQQVPR